MRTNRTDLDETGASSDVSEKRRSQLNTAAAYQLHSLYDSKDLTAAARKRFASRFEREVRQECESLGLSEGEILRRAEARKRAYFIRLSVLAADARRAKAQTKR
jgi:hypothetical protein